MSVKFNANFRYEKAAKEPWVSIIGTADDRIEILSKKTEAASKIPL